MCSSDILFPSTVVNVYRSSVAAIRFRFGAARLRHPRPPTLMLVDRVAVGNFSQRAGKRKNRQQNWVSRSSCSVGDKEQGSRVDYARCRTAKNNGKKTLLISYTFRTMRNSLMCNCYTFV